MDDGRAMLAAQGLRAFTLLFDSLDDISHDALTNTALLRGVEVVSGDGWVALSGSLTQFAGLARAGSNTLPASLTRELGAFLNGITNVPRTWSTARGAVAVDKPLVAGIVNVTPDSFSDGGRYLRPEVAIAHVERLIEAGADMIDVGAESTRPGQPAVVPVEEEWLRLQPVVDELVRRHPTVPLSVDTVKAVIAERALEAGVWAVNDVSALRLDPRIADVCAACGAGLVLNHSRGSFSEMAGYEHAKYDDVTVDVASELMAAVDIAEGRGVERNQIVIDPGLGFAKTPEQNWELLRELPFLSSLGFPIMVGPSRKRFLGAITGKDATDRDTATAAACIAAFFGGAYLFRVHDVGRVKESLVVAEALRST
jgi:dihydropteroate synthase